MVFKTTGVKTKLGFEKYAKQAKKSGRQIKPAYFKMSLPISQEPVHI